MLNVSPAREGWVHVRSNRAPEARHSPVRLKTYLTRFFRRRKIGIFLDKSAPLADDRFPARIYS
jgi:hypothetical protein